MGVGAGFYMYEYDVVVKSSRSLSHLLVSSCNILRVRFENAYSYPKIRVLGQNRGTGDAILTPTNSFLLLGVVTSMPLLAKIDQEMRP